MQRQTGASFHDNFDWTFIQMLEESQGTVLYDHVSLKLKVPFKGTHLKCFRNCKMIHSPELSTPHRTPNSKHSCCCWAVASRPPLAAAAILTLAPGPRHLAGGEEKVTPPSKYRAFIIAEKKFNALHWYKHSFIYLTRNLKMSFLLYLVSEMYL